MYAFYKHFAQINLAKQTNKTETNKNKTHTQKTTTYIGKFYGHPAKEQKSFDFNKLLVIVVVYCNIYRSYYLFYPMTQSSHAFLMITEIAEMQYSIRLKAFSRGISLIRLHHYSREFQMKKNRPVNKEEIFFKEWTMVTTQDIMTEVSPVAIQATQVDFPR